MHLGNLPRLLRQFYRSHLAFQAAKPFQSTGLRFNRFGRRMGLRLLGKGSRIGVGLYVSPVSSTRYFEFPFVESCLPLLPSECLDVSSPSLFALWMASNIPSTSIRMSNPDPDDIRTTAAVIRKLGIGNITTSVSSVDDLSAETRQYDCIWSISVVEHIQGSSDDSDAMRLMYSALKPGGRLIVTVPVDQHFWVEYRPTPPDGPNAQLTEEGYFTQRFYDAAAIEERLVSPVGRKPLVVRWWGEKSRGRFLEYCQRWMRDGVDCTVDDPLEFSEHYQEYASWEEMPGVGVCGLMFEKER